MHYFFSFIVTIATWLIGKMGRIILTSLGIGLFSATVSMTVFNHYISYLQNQYSNLGEIAMIFSLAGIPAGLSIVIGAVVTKITMSASNVVLGRLSR